MCHRQVKVYYQFYIYFLYIEYIVSATAIWVLAQVNQ